MKNKSLFLYGFIFVFGMFLDRISKSIVLHYFPTTYTLTDFFSIELVFNRGISWGLLHSSSDVLFWFVSLIIMCVTAWVIYIAWDKINIGKVIVGEVLVLAGSLSNIIDRFLYKGVIDFIYFFYKGWSFAIFNIADACIVLGVTLMIFQQYKKI